MLKYIKSPKEEKQYLNCRKYIKSERYMSFFDSSRLYLNMII